MRRYKKFNQNFKPKPDDIFRAFIWMYLRKPDMLRKTRRQMTG